MKVQIQCQKKLLIVDTGHRRNEEERLVKGPYTHFQMKEIIPSNPIKDYKKPKPVLKNVLKQHMTMQVYSKSGKSNASCVGKVYEEILMGDSI